ncbi:hypothetical protein ATEIFO6365_0004006400 [Aspergillus terreus]|uniref:Uncharacterized protein n=1 Tax=Aspergillus terreus TaxID=33178 RepID=A0A5M3ZHK8_ASPTE|nr:hypothetical protein ATETN484_0018007000 [Aspergillus terreus]GFF14945.1 hypothetical protein ATEIFO6365_0004006400 [Aspergillus terreus]
MAGVKRKLDSKGSAGTTAAGPAPSTPNSTSADSSHVRVTRSHRASQDARAGPIESHRNHVTPSKNGPPRLSRIITLKTRPSKPDSSPKNVASTSAANATNSPANLARETRASRTRAAAPAVPPMPIVPPVDGETSHSPETPRPKRTKRASIAEETPRTTRQSARLRSHGSLISNEDAQSEEGPAPKKPEPSPSAGLAPATRTRNRSRHVIENNDPVNGGSDVAKYPSPEGIAPDAVVDKSQDPDSSMEPNTHSAEQTQKEGSPSDGKTEMNGRVSDGLKDSAKSMKTPSPILSRKRRASELGQSGIGENSSVSVSPTKKLKLEEGEPEQASGRQDQSTANGKMESHSPAEESKAGDESRQITEEVEGSTPETVPEPTAAKATRGGRYRGRGRGGRSRAGARFAGTRRGRGGTRTRGRSTRQTDRSSDVEAERSPSPSAATQRLRDRQRELDKTFKRVAAAQRLALAVLATQSQKKLARDKNAHKNVPEWEEVNYLLKARLQERQEVFRREYEYKVAQENRLFAAYQEVIEERFRASARHIQEEHLLASQGEYMAFVEGRRAAEDDEHTETDGSETEADRGPVAPPTKQFVRGCNSSAVRNPAGAAAYDRGRFGWDDFVQRAKLGDDIDPQMKQMRESGPLAGLSASEIISLLLEATGVVEVPQNGADGAPPATLPDVRPTALSALADAAAAELPRPSITQTTPRLPSHRTLLPQPSTDHRPFVLPPPTPRQPPRRLLPAGQQIPAISEHLGLPDPFSPMGGPPQLPPPPGSNFQRPPLPGYLAGPHPSSRYFPPPPPPGHRPPY